MFDFLKNIFAGADNSALKDVIKGGAYLVDVRTPGEFSGGHVSGSVNIPLNVLESQLSKLKGKAQIVVFCQSGGRSAQAKSILERNGFTNVSNGGSWFNVNNIVNN